MIGYCYFLLGCEGEFFRFNVLNLLLQGVHGFASIETHHYLAVESSPGSFEPELLLEVLLF